MRRHSKPSSLRPLHLLVALALALALTACGASQPDPAAPVETPGDGDATPDEGASDTPEEGAPSDVPEEPAPVEAADLSAPLGPIPGNMVHFGIKGKRYSLSDEVTITGEMPPFPDRHGPAIIVFGAHWCKPCKAVMKTIAGSKAALDEKGVNVLYVHVDDLDRSEGLSQKKIRGLVKEMAAKPDYAGVRMLLGGDMDEVRTWMDDPGRAALPSIVVVSKDGHVLARPEPSDVASVVAGLLAL